MRLGDLDALIKDICNSCDGACDKVDCDCLACKRSCRCDVITEISEAPTIDPATLAPRWISVEERLPTPYTPVLVIYLNYNDGEPCNDGVAAIDPFGEWGWWDGDEADETVLVSITHWMELPEPPKEGEKE